ncbi:MAG TPA: UDP-N-acetylmuramate--L-alanine ligase [Firmicutes bacterium]|uniref:UDP-N-acetylmuramate--L-alanine ligase n=1 Tax=Candidatus Coatesbacteria bacterium 4484_99 TaxID=1970774 RepID=A0A1W9S177_9BACT|nr:MAG: UDP-N-acetylmuramate--L-alanine ligase [Candidatus Coatesbacteria bacterium 4484_99]RLC40160.1 MAG: UDP-N-acetylmuramate--L-alanine ligase [Candidatus Coatesbacteria bacterium]HDM43263.1 UDP-N-acetylmuramate--L-alanine ligase [Bacillota bacterium]RLC43035.1 MAG: UDP-N-acetylmuramate--L-alanine ligase [Candidatus Coatesbacteria bacterium]RLC44632.1 MAG: UDP-N-acetylmuramate--L-alanine ligase [Candidatus Coatesbacteria bacterium]
MFGRIRRIHMVGIGGSGMSGIAEILKNLGFEITGSDIQESGTITNLRSLGIPIEIGHKEHNVGDAQVVVYSTAIAEDNPELVFAKRENIPTIPRAEMLAELMRMKVGIAVAGTHGKTTTTSMVASVLEAGGLNPTMVIGGRLKMLGRGAYLGKGDYFVVEADESDRTFLLYSPVYVVVTNIDLEHIDNYTGIDDLKETFAQFINKVPFYGCAFLYGDDRNLVDIFPTIRRRYKTYGFASEHDLVARNIELHEDSSLFDLYISGENMGRMKVNMPGEHMVLNALSAIGMGFELGIPVDVIGDALAEFEGVEMRFEVLGEVGEVMVMHDYAHHPTEIKATLDTLSRTYNRRIFAVFQPHLYSRTRYFMDEFAKSFFNAYFVVITDIYPAREEPIPGVRAEEIVMKAREFGHKRAEYIQNKADIPAFITSFVDKGDMIVFLGAGDIWKTARKTLQWLKEEL